MGFAEAIIAFIVFGIPSIAIFGFVSRVYRHREKQLELEAQVASARAADPEYTKQIEERLRVLERIKLLSTENAQLRDEMGSIKDRLANVERIVTDDSHRITQEIEALRAPRNRAMGVAEAIIAYNVCGFPPVSRSGERA